MNKCDFSPEYKQLAADLINSIKQRGMKPYHFPLTLFNAVAAKVITGYEHDHAFKRTMRELMKSKGYKITFGIGGVTVSQIPIIDVDKTQWPALTRNICDRLVDLMKSAAPNGLVLSPATFRNIATIWPNTNDEFNTACSLVMLERGYHLRFTAKFVFVTKKPLHPVVQPRVRLLRGRCMIDLLLNHRRSESWKKGFTHAVTIDIKARVYPDKGIPLSPSVFVGLPDAVIDCNGAALTCLVVGMHDVVLVNAQALEQLQNSTFGLCDSEVMNATIESHFLNIMAL
jgi:hypothetical protein